jgi:hypothetical protein
VRFRARDHHLINAADKRYEIHKMAISDHTHHLWGWTTIRISGDGLKSSWAMPSPRTTAPGRRQSLSDPYCGEVHPSDRSISASSAPSIERHPGPSASGSSRDGMTDWWRLARLEKPVSIRLDHGRRRGTIRAQLTTGQRSSEGRRASSPPRLRAEWNSLKKLHRRVSDRTQR